MAKSVSEDPPRPSIWCESRKYVSIGIIPDVTQRRSSESVKCEQRTSDTGVC